MSGTVNVGALEATLKIGDAYSAIFNKFKTEAATIADRLKKVEERFSQTDRETKKHKENVDKVDAAYRKVAASLDPVIANTQKYERAEVALNNALKLGVITQDQHNKILGQAKEKYLSANAHTLTWREEIHNLSGKISNLSGLLGPFGSQIDNILGNLTAIAGSTAAASKGMATFGAVVATVTSLLTKATTAVRAFLATIGAPVIAAFAAVVVAAGAIYGAFVLISKVVNFVNDAVQNGLKTQLVIEKLNNALAANGSASGLSAHQMVEYAESLELVTARSKEEIVAAETILSRFDSLGREAFPKALDITLAYAKAMGITADAAANKLGPAFEGSTRSLNALKDAGIVFTAGQRKTLTQMVETGKTVEYQALLFDILKEKVGEVGNEYDNNLTRQIGRVKIVMEDFGEGIATEVIPVLEDLFESLANAAGGWEHIKFIVSTAGREIGDIIRKTIYGVMITYHEWESASDQLAAIVLGGLSKIAGGFADFAPLAAFVPGMQGLASLSDEARVASEKLGNAAVKAGMSAAGHEASIVSLSRKLVEHRTALEGDTESHVKLGSAIDEVTAANKRQNDAMAGVNLSIEEMQRRVINLKNAYLAALISTKAYNQEILRQKVMEAIIKEENKLRAVGLKLQEGQRNAIAEAVIAEDEFNRKLKETLALNEKLLSVVLTATDNIAGKGFAADFKRFTDNAHRGMELIQIDVEEMLTGLGKIKDLDLEIEFNSRLMDVEPHLRNLETDYLSFLENIGSGFELAGENAIEAGERIIATLGDRFGVTVDEIRDKLQSLNDAPAIEAFQLAGRSVLQVYRDEQKEIKRIVAAGAKEGVDITEGGQKLINEKQTAFWNENLSNWSSALDFLAGEFGGFFNYLARAVQSLQQAGGFGQSVGNIAAGMGAKGSVGYGGFGGTGAMGAAAGMGATVAVFALIYSWGKELLAASKSRNYGTGTDFSLRNFQESTSQLDAGARETVKAIRGMIKSLEDALRISISDLGEIGIKVRNDGEKFKAYFKGVLIGKFNSFEEAMGEALRLAFSDPSTIIQGLSDLMKQGLKEFTVPDFEELTDFLADLREISDLQLGGNAVQFIESIRHLDDLWQTLNKLREVTPAVTQGFQDLITTEIRSWQAWSDSITGRQKTPAELLAEKKQEAEIFEAQKKFRIAELELKKLGLQADLAWLQGKGNILQGDGKLKQGELNLGISFLQAKGELFKAELTLNEQWILAIQAQIEAITVLINSLAEIPTIDIDKIKIPKGKGGGQKDAVRDWIGDKRFELNTRGMDEWARRAAEISRQYDQQLEQAGKDKKLRAELIALKERELALLDQEHMAAVQGSYDDFTKQASAFEQVRDTANELIKSIEGSPFGDTKKAEMIANVFEEINRQIEELSLSEAASLFSGLIGEMEKFGASESELSEARKHLAIIEHTLNVINYRTRFEILKAEGKLSKEILATLDKSIKFVEGVDPLKIIDGVTGTSSEPLVSSEWLSRQTEMSTAVDKTVSDLEKLREAFVDAKTRIIDEVLAFDRGEFGAIVPEQSWAEAQRQFDAIISSAKLGNIEAFQDAPEAFRNTLDVLKGFSPALFATLAPQLRDQFKGLADLTTIKQGNVVITDFEKRTQHKEVVNTLSGGFSSLSSISSEQAETLNRILIEQQKATIANEDIKNRLVRLESGTFGKREIA